MKKMQLDVFDSYLARVLPMLINLYNYFSLEFLTPKEKPIYDSLINILKNWNGLLDRDGKAPLIISVWEDKFKSSLFQK